MTDAPAIKPKFKGIGVRLISAVGLLLLCMAPFYFGGWAWAVLAGVFGGRMLFEWVRMSDTTPSLQNYAVPIIGLVVGVIYVVQHNFGYAALAVILTMGAVATLQVFRASADTPARIGWAVLGVVYVIIPALIIVAMRGNDIGFDTVGFKRVLFILACVIGADVGAYFGGSTFGGPKLAPKLSPNKTWSGFVAGQLTAIALGALIGHLIGIGAVSGAILALPIAILSVLGDLFESGIKRKLNVKDTGGLMPGHGGLLDRLDSLMAAILGAAIVLALFPHVWPV